MSRRVASSLQTPSTPRTREDPPIEPNRSSARSVVIAVGTLAIAWGIVFAVSPYAAVLALTDGLPAGLIVGVLVVAGTWCTALGDWREIPLRWQLLAGAVVGIGASAALILILGALGFLNRPLWLAIGGVLAVLAALRLPALWRIRGRHSPDPSASHAASWVWVSAAPFLALALLSATTPPGVLWQEEANGYDVLEYHLGVPKEYFEQGRIAYLPHNIYSNFPFNYEMFALLAMVLWDSPHEAVFTAKLFNVAFAALLVFAAWALGRDLHPLAGTATGLLAAGCPWLAYLCGVAFVENGMLFMIMAALAFAIRALGDAEPTPPRSNVVFAGLAAGFAGGFKYTALPMVALPVFGILLFDGLRRGAKRWKPALLFGVCAVAAVAPWLIKNASATGNPVFPLAARIFPATEEIWPADLVERWHSGHRPGPDEAAPRARLGLLWSRVLADGRIGPALLLLAAAALVLSGSDRIVRYLLFLLAVQLAVWMFATHLYARFAVPIIPMLLALSAFAVPAARARLAATFFQPAAVGLLLVGLAVHLYPLGRLYYHHAFPDGGPDAIHFPPDAFVRGSVPGSEYVGAINERLGPEDNVLLVGEARHFYIRRPVSYAVVFSPSPFLQAVRRYAGDENGRAQLVQWLRDNRYSHLYVGWSEVARLAGSYGFSEKIRPELFADMRKAGLIPLEAFRWSPQSPPYGELYEVPRP